MYLCLCRCCSALAHHAPTTAIACVLAYGHACYLPAAAPLPACTAHHRCRTRTARKRHTRSALLPAVIPAISAQHSACAARVYARVYWLDYHGWTFGLRFTTVGSCPGTAATHATPACVALHRHDRVSSPICRVLPSASRLYNRRIPYIFMYSVTHNTQQ